MTSLKDFEYLVIGLFRAPLADVRAAAENILKVPPGPYVVRDAPLDIRSIYVGRPPSGGAHETRAVLFEPASSRGTTALFTNLEDGWVTMCNLLAGRVPGEHVHVRSCIDKDYPASSMEVWDGGTSVRYVQSLREDPSWEFYQKGELRSFEDPANYKKRRIADRLNREILLTYLAKLGWDLTSPEFWKSQRSAVYLEEKRSLLHSK